MSELMSDAITPCPLLWVAGAGLRLAVHFRGAGQKGAALGPVLNLLSNGLSLMSKAFSPCSRDAYGSQIEGLLLLPQQWGKTRSLECREYFNKPLQINQISEVVSPVAFNPVSLQPQASEGPSQFITPRTRTGRLPRARAAGASARAADAFPPQKAFSNSLFPPLKT